ncbi:MAG: hypothetical protein KDE54_08520 [Caldilineaceae bacterium]|nr:hypothetical protein [Caldilineaceae bacterium]
MYIAAVIGNESHSTSSGWSKISINGKRMSHRDASTKEWITKFGDKHASWCECTFSVVEGDAVAWEAGSNSGPRGREKVRIDLRFTVDSSAQYDESPLGYPAANARLAGKLLLLEDTKDSAASAHRALVKEVTA